MQSSQWLNQFWNPNVATTLPALAIQLAMAALLSFLLGLVYLRFGKSLSNRRLFARNFLVLAVTTTLVISIVKSSLALSLGLVGALSIVRFRAAIKEPEELAYLFLAISIGLGFGAGQTMVTCTAFVIIVAIIVVQNAGATAPESSNLFLTLTGAGEVRLSAADVLARLQENGVAASLLRLDESPDRVEAAFRVAPTDAARIEAFNRQMRARDGGLRVSWLADRGIAD